MVDDLATRPFPGPAGSDTGTLVDTATEDPGGTGTTGTAPAPAPVDLDPCDRGDTPSGQDDWETYDNSMLALGYLDVETRSAGNYPCNPAGVNHTNSSNCYTTDCRVGGSSVWVR